MRERTMVEKGRNHDDSTDKEIATKALTNPTSPPKRMGARSPQTTNSGTSVSALSASGVSRRSQSIVNTKDEAELFEHLSSINNVKLPPKNASTVQSAMNMADKALAEAKGLVSQSTQGAATITSDPKTYPTLGMGDDTSSKAAVSSIPTWAKSPSGADSVDTPSGSASSRRSKHLDLKHNDNSFHVIADLIVDRFLPKLDSEKSTIVLSTGDHQHLDKIVPPSVRMSFVEAVRYRLANLPPDSEKPIHILTRKCKELGLEKEGNQNMLLASLSPEEQSIAVTGLPPVVSHSTTMDTNPVMLKSPPVASANQAPSFSNTTTGALASQFDRNDEGSPMKSNVNIGVDTVLSVEEQNEALREQLKQQQRQLEQQQAFMSRHLPPPTVAKQPEEASVVESAITGPEASVVGGQVADTEMLARQQLMAELREASNLMAESVTPEAASFWRNHVVELQARLRALHGEGGSLAHVSEVSQTSSSTGVTPEQNVVSDINNANYNPPPMPGARHNSHMQAPHMSNAQAFTGNAGPAFMPSEQATARTTPMSAAGNSFVDLPMVDVVAPADLPGGFHFEAEIEGRTFLATVPEGGVRRGETFTSYMRDVEREGAGTPVGRWRDGVFDCLRHGCLHPMLLTAVFCPIIVLGQVMERLNFDFLGRPNASMRGAKGFALAVTIVSFWLFMNLFVVLSAHFKIGRGGELSAGDICAFVFVNVAMLSYSIYATSATRGNIREKYLIREDRFYDIEDCLCATFCMPCTICQMARHTAQYEQQDAEWFSETGLRGDKQQIDNPANQGRGFESNYVV